MIVSHHLISHRDMTSPTASLLGNDMLQHLANDDDAAMADVAHGVRDTSLLYDYISGGNYRGSQGMGVVSDNWFDSVLLSIPYMFEPSS